MPFRHSPPVIIVRAEQPRRAAAYLTTQCVFLSFRHSIGIGRSCNQSRPFYTFAPI